MCLLSCSVLSNSKTHGWEPAKVLCAWDSPGKNTGVDSHSLLLGILPDLGVEPRFLVLWMDSSLSETPGKHNMFIQVCAYIIYMCLHKEEGQRSMNVGRQRQILLIFMFGDNNNNNNKY